METETMKTINSKTGNRNNKFEKIVLRSGAIIASVILLSFTVSAHGLWKQLLTYNSFGKTAILMIGETGNTAEKPSTEATPAENSLLNIETAIDKTLEIEPWMTDDYFFGAFNHLNDAATDNPLELEEWMLNDTYFSSRIVPEKDPELKIEPWMTDNKYWAQR